jgi:LysM repeat protein
LVTVFVWGGAVGRGSGLLAAVCAAELTACGVLGQQHKVATPPAAPARQTSTTTTTVAMTTYIVARGDTLTSIGKRFGVTTDAIAAANHLTNLNVLAIGLALRIPPVLPLTLTVTPSQGPAGTEFTLHVTGMRSTDQVTFSIAQPGHHPFTGPQHSAGADGSVSATYDTYPTDPAGSYVVLARSSNGRGAFASFRVMASTPTTLSVP